MDNRKRNKTLSIRLTETEKNKIINKAKKSKMTVTDYVVSLSDKKEIKLPPDLSPVILEMKRLGNNLNQIAMKLNSGVVYSGVVYTPDFKSVLDNQKVIYELIYKLSEKTNGYDYLHKRNQANCQCNERTD